MMINIANYLKDRGVTRLCHFTKLQGLAYIFDDGILPRDVISTDVKNVTDQTRYDGSLDCVCCSIEYPNSWYLKKVIRRDTDEVFKDWIIIYIDLDILNHREIRFCPCNAATGAGKYILCNSEDIVELYAQKNLLGRSRTYKMLDCCPTDDQAELLIKGNIPYEYFIGIVVGYQELAESVSAMIKTCDKEKLPIYIAPDVINTRWSELIRQGERPIETIF